MQLKNVYHLNEDQIQNVIRIIGVCHKKPYSYARINNNSCWEVLESEQRNPINGDTSLIKKYEISDWNKLLDYYNKIGLLPFCPRSDILSNNQCKNQSIQKNNDDILHRRHQVRRKVRLTGKIVNKRNLKESEVLINDVSFNGSNFSPIDDCEFYVDDTAYLEFWIQNRNGSKIERTVQVKHITHKNIGGEFVNKPKLDTELGFYLMFDVQ